MAVTLKQPNLVVAIFHQNPGSKNYLEQNHCFYKIIIGADLGLQKTFEMAEKCEKNQVQFSFFDSKCFCCLIKFLYLRMIRYVL